jgi:CYTH domain-containing protein
MIIYDIDKIIREPLRVKMKGETYEVNEPSVKTFGLIQKELEERLEANPIEGQKWLIKLLIPDIPLEDITNSELSIIGKICTKVLSGKHLGKIPAPEKIMERIL